MTVVQRLNGLLARRLWQQMQGWAPRHPDVVLHDPKAETRPVGISVPFRFTVAGREIEVSLQNMRQYKRWRAAAQAFNDGTAARPPEAMQPIHRWLQERLTNTSIFYDIGANIGIITAIASVLRPSAQIFSFEPEPNSFLQLCRMIGQNRMNAIAYPFALSNWSRLGTFHVNRAFEPGLSNHQLDRTVINTGESFTPAAQLGTAVFTVDSLVYDYGLPAPTLIKVDVDGIEPQVVDGMSRLLTDQYLKSVMTEATGEANVARITDVMRRNGFACIEGPPQNLGDNPCDLIFVRG